MKYAVDQIIENIVILENIETLEKKEIELLKLPKDIHEGSILIKERNYKIDKKEEALRRSKLQEKLKKLKN